MTLTHFLHMGGYGVYVWTSYSLVVTTLGVTFFKTYRSWRSFLKQQQRS